MIKGQERQPCVAQFAMYDMLHQNTPCVTWGGLYNMLQHTDYTTCCNVTHSESDVTCSESDVIHSESGVIHSE